MIACPGPEDSQEDVGKAIPVVMAFAAFLFFLPGPIQTARWW